MPSDIDNPAESPEKSLQTRDQVMQETIKLQSDDVQLKKYRELAQMLRQWSDEPDDTDWSVIEAEINSAGMKCRDDGITSAKENVPHAPHA